jgi:hypothetical protein
MKKRIVTLVLMLSLGFSSVFANNEEGISLKATTAFKKEFNGAVNVKWEAGKEFSKATFELSGQVMFAYYSNEGELMAVTRNIMANQLPFKLLSPIKTNYKQSWISDLFEISSHGETTYYVTLESADSKVVLRSQGTAGWEQYKKEKKIIAE